MFRALVELGNKLEKEDKLPPVGFYDYGDPIRWVVNIWTKPTLKVDLEETELPKARPYSGRTSGIAAHPVADEAAYSLGVSLKADGGTDKNASKKHDSFVELLNFAIEFVSNQDLTEALRAIKNVLEQNLVQSHTKFVEITSKDWVSFKLQDRGSSLFDQHLFEHPEIRRLWIEEAQKRSAQKDKSERFILGECSTCGKRKPLVARIPLQVKLNSTAPLHSLNQNAFVSFVSGSSAFKDTHIGMCFECGDTAARAFNYLSSNNSQSHRKSLIRDKFSRDSLKNQIALFWLNKDESVTIESVQGAITLDVNDLLEGFTNVLSSVHEEDNKNPIADPNQLRELLKFPWKPSSSALNLNQYGFYLAVISPNVGRLAVREWVSVSLKDLLGHLDRYLQALTIVLPSGNETQAANMTTLLNACDISDPNLLRGLLRTAYLGIAPPLALLNAAVQRFKSPETHEELWRLHSLVSAMKLILSYGKEEAESMQELNERHETKAYLCGRILAIIEKAQEISQQGSSLDDDKGKGSRSMLVDRFYGGASSTPATSFPTLVRLLKTAYLPQLRKNDQTIKLFYWLENMMGEAMVQLKSSGGFPQVLNLSEQAEFALGFYCQRAAFRKSNRIPKEVEGQTIEGVTA